MNNEWTIDLTGYILDAGTFDVGTAVQGGTDAEGNVTARIEMTDSETVHIVFSIGNWIFYMPPEIMEFLAQLARIKLRLDRDEE